MSRQLSYNYQTPKGTAGSLYDISPYAIDSRVNGGSKAEAMMFGMGAVRGDTPGTNVVVPKAADTADKFEGVILTGYTNMMNMDGDVKIEPLQTVGLLRWGRAWVRVDPDAEDIAYGDKLYLISDGEKAGLFTNDDDDGDNLAIKGRFIGGLGSGNIAPAEIYNQMA